MDEINHQYTSELVCPYCGHEHTDSWELADTQDRYDCESCSKRFSYTSEITRTFTSKAVPCLNGAPHDFKKMVGLDPLYPDAKRCKWCGKCEYGERKAHD